MSERIKSLDGLRGISILIVLVGHSVSWTDAPWLLRPLFDPVAGVRLFFAISGYIITLLLLEEKSSTGTIVWRAFLLRRATKLLPSLLFYLTVVYLTGWVVENGCSAGAYFRAAFFLTGIFGTGCWSLSHTWTLAVEELFYLTWAPLVALWSKRASHWVALVAIVLGPMARFYNALDLGGGLGSPFPRYVSILPNIDCIAWGALAALTAPGGKRGTPTWLPLGIVLSYFTMVDYQSSSHWLAYLGPLSPTVLGFTCFALFRELSARGESPPTAIRLLEFSPLTSLGRISYSVYLVQQLILSPFIPYPHALPRIAIGLIQLSGCLMAGAIVFRWVEFPAMKWLRRKLSLASTRVRFGSAGTDRRASR